MRAPARAAAPRRAAAARGRPAGRPGPAGPRRQAWSSSATTRSCSSPRATASSKCAAAGCTTTLVRGAARRSSFDDWPYRCTRAPARANTRARAHQRAPRAGNYSQFLEQRAQREAQERATAEAQQAEIARLEGFVTRFGAKCAPAHGASRARMPAGAAAGRRPVVVACVRGGAGRAVRPGRARRASKASQAQSRQKQLEKLRESAVPLPAAASGAGPGDARKVRPRPPAPRAGPCAPAPAPTRPRPPRAGGAAAAQGAALRRGHPAARGGLIGSGPPGGSASRGGRERRGRVRRRVRPSAGAAPRTGGTRCSPVRASLPALTPRGLPSPPAAAVLSPKRARAGVDLTVKKGQRILVLGPNGAGAPAGCAPALVRADPRWPSRCVRCGTRCTDACCRPRREEHAAEGAERCARRRSPEQYMLPPGRSAGAPAALRAPDARPRAAARAQAASRCGAGAASWATA